jgi:hypothetical protein
MMSTFEGDLNNVLQINQEDFNFLCDEMTEEEQITMHNLNELKLSPSVNALTADTPKSSRKKNGVSDGKKDGSSVKVTGRKRDLSDKSTPPEVPKTANKRTNSTATSGVLNDDEKLVEKNEKNLSTTMIQSKPPTNDPPNFTFNYAAQRQDRFIIPTNYPEVKIGEKIMEEFSDFFFKKICELPAEQKGPQVLFRHLENGMIRNACLDNYTIEFLVKIVKEFPCNLQLKVVGRNEIPTLPTFSVFVRRMALSVDVFRRCLALQNSEVKVSDWNFLSSRNLESGTSFIVSMSEQEAKNIHRRSGYVFFDAGTTRLIPLEGGKCKPDPYADCGKTAVRGKRQATANPSNESETSSRTEKNKRKRIRTREKIKLAKEASGEAGETEVHTVNTANS